MNKPVLYILLSFLNIYCFGQSNLVPNHSFEDTVYCPIGTAQPDALAVWYNPTSASPDYYNSCSPFGAGVPINDWGFQMAQSGNAYVGLATIGFNILDYREYLQVKLSEPLVKDQIYCWSMWISLLDSVDFASNNIGIALSTTPSTAFGSDNLLPISFYGYENTIQYDAVGWVKIGSTFKAIGGEEYLTIGNFLPDAMTSIVQLQQNSIGGEAAYYYVDNVFLGECTTDFIFPNVFTPNGDGNNDLYTFLTLGVDEFDFRVLNRWGESVYQSSNNISWDGTFNGVNCNDGQYFYVYNFYNSSTKTNETKTGFIQLIR